MSSPSNFTIVFSHVGKAQKAQGQSLETFLATLVTSGITSLALLLAYILVKARSLGSFKKPAQLIQWSPWLLVFPLPCPDMRHSVQLDNYLLDRYLHTLFRLFSLFGIVLMPILVPLSLVGGGNRSIRGLDRLTFSNIGPTQTERYWAHLILAVFAVVCICAIIRYELRVYKKFLLKFSCAQGQSAPMVLLSSHLDKITPKSIENRLNCVAGGISAIIVAHDCSEILNKIRYRSKVILKLEEAETKLIRKVLISIHKLNGKSSDGRTSNWQGYLHGQKRPSMWISKTICGIPLPLLGGHVDTIYHCRSEVVRYTQEIKEAQRHIKRLPIRNSVIVQFNRPLQSSNLRAYIPKSWNITICASKNDIIWANTSLTRLGRNIRTLLVSTLTLLLGIGFALPVSFSGTLSQAVYLISFIPWLNPVNRLPGWFLASIQGVLPTLMLEVVMAVAPSAIRTLVGIRGALTYQDLENTIQRYYFTFLFFQVFLIASLSASITTVVVELRNSLDSVPTILAQNLLKGSNYFFSYIILRSVSTISSTLMPLEFLIGSLKAYYFQETARQKWQRESYISFTKWGTFVPVYTNIACISIIFCVAAPLINLFSALAFGALWVSHQCYPPTSSRSNSGLETQFYPTAMRQLFTGVYFMEICLVGLFILVRDINNQRACTPQAIIMAIVTLLTLVFQLMLESVEWKVEARIITIAREPRPRAYNKPNLVSEEISWNQNSTVWIPHDTFGIASNEIRQTREYDDSILISSKGVSISSSGELTLQAAPPDILSDEEEN